MPMCNLLEYSDSYSVTSGTLSIYVNDAANKNNDSGNHRVNNNKTTTLNFFRCKTKILGSTPDNISRLNAEVVV